MLRVIVPRGLAPLPPECPYVPTLGGLLAALERSAPGVLARLLLPDGRLRPEWEILLSGQPVSRLDTPLVDGVTVEIRRRGAS